MGGTLSENADTCWSIKYIIATLSKRACHQLILILASNLPTNIENNKKPSLTQPQITDATSLIATVGFPLIHHDTLLQ